jgi:hypothetical protein
MQRNKATSVRTTATHHRTRIVLIESNPLTVWAIKKTLAASYDLVCCSTLEEARAELAMPNVVSVICGSPIVDDHPEALSEIAQIAGRRVLALVSDTDREVPPNVRVLEKPFDLMRLTELLGDAQPTAIMTTLSPKEALADRLRLRIEDEVCPLCIHQTSDGGCSLQHGPERGNCPAFKWAHQLAELVEGVESNRLGDYADQIQAIICPECKQSPDGRCKARERLDCPIDLYLGLLIPIVEEELERAQLMKK